MGRTTYKISDDSEAQVAKVSREGTLGDGYLIGRFLVRCGHREPMCHVNSGVVTYGQHTHGEYELFKSGQ